MPTRLSAESSKPVQTSQLALVVEKPLPFHAFPDEFIECTLRLQHSEQVTLPISFHVALVHADTKLTTETTSHLVRMLEPILSNRHVLLKALDPSTPLVFTTDVCTFRFQMRNVVNNMCLRCYLPDPHHMVSVMTSAFTIVQEKLVVTEQPPDVWFKDEGGRDKCMTIQVQVQAAPGRAVSPRIIPLELSLLYDSGEVVQASASATSPSSGILKLFPDLRPNITDGNVRISFRIEDVSKNHQNHSFMLKIAPESSNVYADIASVCTAPVAIRSKRNKRRLAGLKSPSNASTSSPSTSARPRMLPTPVHATPTHEKATPGGARRTHPSSTPHNLPRARPSWLDTMEEWTIIGYEVHADGSMNKDAPIYRCMACMALNDSSHHGAHSPSCDYFRSRQQHYTPRPHRVQTPHMVYGYNHQAYTPSANTNQTPVGSAYTPTNHAAYTPTNQASHVFGKPEPNIFLTPAKPHTPSPAEATAAKPMMTMEMYLQVMNMANNNANAQIFTQESCVAYIWAQMQSDMRGDKMGLAAFDQYRQLIGFYKENQDVTQQEQQQQRPQMVFSPLSEFPFCDTTAICSGLESAVQYGSPAVFALSKYMGNLVKLQEEALMHYWSQNLMQ
ncbi:hypothetical protein LEN26_015991 [Aphanomyces euteiches]|nr:hypothetical protein LEN26_015991 [Aphanomyces euteiches]KAH9112562.1 hypothetical protein AeMF1_013120 [Aphanomyces euteiches]KAH9196350.1 hypothetical protein AeNC1_001671 [Aphanomyces euteiches]